MASPSSLSAALEPLSFSLPRRGGGTGIQALNLLLLRLLGLLGRFFCSSETLFENDIEKTSKKARKSRILASQNPPKTLPKWLRKRCSKKHAIFYRFLLEFCFFRYPRFLENHGFPIGKSLFLRFSLKSCLSLLACIFGSKNLPKTLKKRRPKPLKIDAGNCLFSNIDFWGFGSPFWKVLGLQIGAKLGSLGSQDRPWNL